MSTLPPSHRAYGSCHEERWRLRTRHRLLSCKLHIPTHTPNMFCIPTYRYVLCTWKLSTTDPVAGLAIIGQSSFLAVKELKHAGRHCPASFLRSPRRVRLSMRSLFIPSSAKAVRGLGRYSRGEVPDRCRTNDGYRVMRTFQPKRKMTMIGSTVCLSSYQESTAGHKATLSG